MNTTHLTHKVAAIKVISLLRNPPPDRRALQKEVQIHAILKHPQILTFLGVEERGLNSSERGRYLPGVYIVLELAGGGDLFDKITPDAGVETDLAHFYFSQLMAGLEYIHGQGVAHRDIKPENMLLDDQGNLKIADFGLCSVYKHKGREREMRGACGSLPYIAPEMNGRPYRGEPVDVWSAGVVLFALLVGNTPWDEPTSRAPEYVAYVQGNIFEYDPWNRIRGDELCESLLYRAFITSQLTFGILIPALLRAMMNPDPTKRITFEAIKRHRWYTRSNPLLEPKSTQCTDPATLAERLLQGLIMHGEMDHVAPISVEERAKELHSDGGRADLPDAISFTQPETIGRRGLHLGSGGAGAPMDGGSLPASTAAPQMSRRSDFLDSLSQQLSTRRHEFTMSQGVNRIGQDAALAAPTGSQFTQALNFMTQPNSIVSATTMGLTPNLTRFLSDASASTMATRLSTALHHLRVQHTVEPLGETILEANDATPSAADDVEDAEMQHEENGPEGVETDGMSRSSSTSDTTIRRPEAAAASSATSVAEGSRGIRIRLGLIDSRKCPLKGEVRIERLRVGHDDGAVSTGAPTCLVMMRRSRGDPLEWRKLFGRVVKDPSVRECVSR